MLRRLLAFFQGNKPRQSPTGDLSHLTEAELLGRQAERGPNSEKAYQEYLKRRKNVDPILSQANEINKAKVSETDRLMKTAKTLEEIDDDPLHEEDKRLKYVIIGGAYKKLKDYERAVCAYRKAIESGHKTGHAQKHLSISLEKLGRINEAIEVCQNVVNDEEFGDQYIYESKKRLDRLLRKRNGASKTTTGA